MNPLPRQTFLFIASTVLACALPVLSQTPPKPPVMVELENRVEVSRPPAFAWEAAKVGRSLELREIVEAHKESRATILISELRQIRVKSDSKLRISPSLLSDTPLDLNLQKGEIYLHSREPGPGITVTTPSGVGKSHHTQFRVRVEEDGSATFTVFDGAMELHNDHGDLNLLVNQEGVMEPGKAPRRTARIVTKNILQWCLYYPGVLHIPDLGLTPAEQTKLAIPLTSYRAGDLLKALVAWPKGYLPQSAATRVFRATLLLSVGQVEDARAALASVPPETKGRRALEEMIDAVNFIKRPHQQDPRSASEWLARSYYEQSQSHEKDALKNALAAARKALEIAPDFGFAAVRCAELEFSFGHTKAAMKELSRGLQLSPRNAQAYALQGFMFSGWNRMAEARASFDTAIRLDSALGNAWLGRGLCSIRSGHSEAGRRDLQTAVVLEPNRSLLHSYYGKASAQAGLMIKAREDLDYAKLLDPKDPTPWLYSALLHQEQYRPNLAIGDLQESIKLNDNRRLYRSDLLLDQDRAVRGANLAKLYQYSGMKDVAVREATRAVESDYTNPSAHLFLANSFDALRDPNRILLRYETPWFNELLLSNLLSPVGGGQLSQFVSQQEYSKLLEADGVGGNFTTQWRDTSELRSTASVYGTQGNISYGLDAYYRNDPGTRPNSQMEQQEFYGQFKWQATPDDIFYFLGKWAGQKSGSITENFDNSANPDLSFEENQEPGLLLAGWNHRWGPGSNTLFLGGNLSFEQSFSDPTSQILTVYRDRSGLISGPDPFLIKENGLFYKFRNKDLTNIEIEENKIYAIHKKVLLKEISKYLGTGEIKDYRTLSFDAKNQRSYNVYTAEIQHIEQTDRNTLLFGGRWQQGYIKTNSKLTIDSNSNGYFSNPASYQHIESDFLRTGLYIYDYWNILPRLTLIGGMAWDTMNHPENFRYSPISDQQKWDKDISAKFGFTCEPNSSVTIRGLAAGGMGGLSYDESVRLEPSQLAGFRQAYRTVISESLVGSVEAPFYQIYGLSAEGTLPTRTWWGASVNVIEQKVSRATGVFTGYDLPGADPTFFSDSHSQNLAYDEANLGLTFNQLIGDELSVGMGYRLTESKLQQTFPALGNTLGADLKDRATLQELSLFGDWNSPSGFFVHLEANAFAQDLDDDPDRETLNDPKDKTKPRSGDKLIQFNAWLGYRFNRNRSEITAGVLNIGDTDYQLSPLNPYADIARNRTFFVMCRFGF